MKKIILLLTLTLGLYQATNAQSACAYTYSQSGNSVTFNHLWPIALIYTLDSVRFNFGDGNTQLHTLPVPTSTNHTYPGSGTYNACLTRYLSQLGNPTPIPCTYCDSITIGNSQTSCFVNAGFNATPGAGLSVSFQNTTTCNSCTSLTTLWDYGDGNTSTIWQGTHTYMIPGTYTVCLYETGIDSNNITCIDTSCTVVTVSQSSGCATSISLSSTNSSITATGFATGGTAPYSYSYVLNPGNVTSLTGNFTGLAPGFYTVCVTATDNNNNTCSTACDSVSIGNTISCMATIQASASGNSITSLASAAGGTTPYTYSYNLNPGNITNSTGNFTGLANGLYSVCVTAIDANQDTCTIACDTAMVGAVSPCTTTIQSSVSGNTITASATSIGGSAPYTYTLNPGSQTNTTGIFSGLTPGLYVICATATNNSPTGCTPDCDTLVVSPITPGGCLVNANFTESLNGLTATFTNNSTISNGTIATYGWSFGDGSGSTAPSPVHTYSAAGTYNVILAVNGYDSLQIPCIDSFSKSITVSIPFGVNTVSQQELTIYPNPTAKNITLEIPNSEKVQSLVITDVSGRTIETNYQKIDQNKLTIGLKNHADGIYFIKLLTDKHIYTSSIMKQE